MRRVGSSSGNLPPGVSTADLPGQEDPPRCPGCDRLISHGDDHVDSCEYDGYSLDELAELAHDREQRFAGGDEADRKEL